MCGEEQFFGLFATVPMGLQGQFVTQLIPGLQPSLRYRRKHLYMGEADVHPFL